MELHAESVDRCSVTKFIVDSITEKNDKKILNSFGVTN